jgi:hypothetical protein
MMQCRPSQGGIRTLQGARRLGHPFGGETLREYISISTTITHSLILGCAFSLAPGPN